MSAPVWSEHGGRTAESNKRIPALFCLKLWTSLQSESSTWLFPEHCLETKRGDVTPSGTEARTERDDVGGSHVEVVSEL